MGNNEGATLVSSVSISERRSARVELTDLLRASLSMMGAGVGHRNGRATVCKRSCTLTGFWSHCLSGPDFIRGARRGTGGDACPAISRLPAPIGVILLQAHAGASAWGAAIGVSDRTWNEPPEPNISGTKIRHRACGDCIATSLGIAATGAALRRLRPCGEPVTRSPVAMAGAAIGGGTDERFRASGETAVSPLTTQFCAKAQWPSLGGVGKSCTRCTTCLVGVPCSRTTRRSQASSADISRLLNIPTCDPPSPQRPTMNAFRLADGSCRITAGTSLIPAVLGRYHTRSPTPKAAGNGPAVFASVVTPSCGHADLAALLADNGNPEAMSA